MSKLTWLVGCSLFSACAFDGSNALEIPESGRGETDAGAQGSDSSVLTGPDGGVPCKFRNTDICESGEPDSAFAVPAGTSLSFDTTNSERCRSITVAGSEVCLLYTKSFTLPESSSLRVIGTLPLLLASDSTILINGNIDVGSKAEEGENVSGPGASGAQCPAATTAVADDGGGGGGSGGSFGSSGGNGGVGDTNNAPDDGSGGNAAGSVAIPSTSFVIAGAGCSGSIGGGGAPDDATAAGLGGLGGGGLALIAIENITQNLGGTILAGGAGGQGGDSQGGGGGGGSGGSVYFEAETVDLNGLITAEGGGGGGGGIRNRPRAESGKDGNFEVNGSSGGGGITTSQGASGEGGDGATFDLSGGIGESGSAGGGGGGGGGGHVVVRGIFTGGVISVPLVVLDE